uniref:Uncharacterized protein n=1 Tax=Arundo donax TaxID=35708 RepID=A0A0A9FWZ1_ARUDO
MMLYTCMLIVKTSMWKICRLQIPKIVKIVVCFFYNYRFGATDMGNFS